MIQLTFRALEYMETSDSFRATNQEFVSVWIGEFFNSLEVWNIVVGPFIACQSLQNGKPPWNKWASSWENLSSGFPTR